MLEQKLFCDGCGKEIPLRQDIERGAFVFFKKKLIPQGKNLVNKIDREGYDLCVDCALRIEDFIKSLDKKNKKE